MAVMLRMPQLGESVVEGQVGRWLTQVGQHVDQDQPLVEILTDKADSELPAPTAGVVTKILAPEGTVVKVGAELCEIDSNAAPSAEAAPADTAVTSPGAAASPALPAARAPAAPPPAPQPAPPTSSSHAGTPSPIGAPSSPTVRRLAREHGIDLDKLSGSGGGGRVTREDVLRIAAQGDELTPTSIERAAPAAKAAPVQAPAAARSGAFRMPPYVPHEGDQVVPLSRRRQIIADHMVFSKLTAPHVVTFAECDLHRVAKLRDAHKGVLRKEGVNLTYLAFVAAATARALSEHRTMNSRMLDDAYVILSEINLGIAVDTDEGLVVPVLRHADELSVKGLARAIDELASKARDGNLAPDDLAGKTFTISNPGRRGNMVGGAIISQPNVGILRTGEIKKRVVVVEHDGEDLMAIHPVMYVALSYDHRVVDGVAANGFLYRVVELLEEGDFNV